MNRKNINWRPALGVLIILALFFGLVFLTMNRLVLPKSETAVEKTIDLPLSRCTVEIRVDVFKTAVEKSGWAEYKAGTLSAKEDKNKFSTLVNKNGLAERIAAEYPEQFKWDPNGAFTMPITGSLFDHKFITVPTWVLFAFSEYLEYSENKN